MKSETDIRQELGLLERDLKDWRASLERAREPERRIPLGNTIIACEERIASLKWVLEEE